VDDFFVLKNYSIFEINEKIFTPIIGFYLLFIGLGAILRVKIYKKI